MEDKSKGMFQKAKQKTKRGEIEREEKLDGVLMRAGTLTKEREKGGTSQII